MHADFLRVDVKKAIHATVPVHLVGRPQGVETGGGILEQLTREVEVECLPTEIPSFFEVDVTALEIGDSLHVSNIQVPDNIKCLTDETYPLATVLAPRLVVEPTVSAEEEAEEGAEEAAEGVEESTPEEE
jgi:large subunit ribosomal protein L25